MYKALVRSYLDYCDIIYHIPSKQNQFGEILNTLMEKAERIHYQAALVITGAWQGSNRSKLYDELGWECLSDRRWCRRILQIHKIVNNWPCYLKNKRIRFRKPFASTLILFMEKDVNQIDTWIVSSQVELTLGISSSHILKQFPLLICLKNIFYLLFTQRRKVFSVYMILLDFETFFS